MTRPTRWPRARAGLPARNLADPAEHEDRSETRDVSRRTCTACSATGSPRSCPGWIPRAKAMLLDDPQRLVASVASACGFDSSPVGRSFRPPRAGRTEYRRHCLNFQEIRPIAGYLPSFAYRAAIPAAGIRRGSESGQQPDRAGLDAAAAGRVTTVNWSAGDVIGRRGSSCRGVAAALGQRPVRLVEKDQLEPSGRVLRLNGTNLAPFLTRQQAAPRWRRTESTGRWRRTPVGEVEHARPQRACQLIDQGSPRRGRRRRPPRPAAGPGADVRDDADVGFRAARGHAERMGQLVKLNTSAVVPSKEVTSMPCHAIRCPGPRRCGGLQLEGRRVTCSPDSALALDSARPVGFRAGLEVQPGIPRAMRGPRHSPRREQGPGQHASRVFFLRPAPGPADGRPARWPPLVDDAAGEELLEQARAVQVLQPVRPQLRAGQDPAGQVRPQAGLLLSPGRDSRPALRG